MVQSLAVARDRAGRPTEVVALVPEGGRHPFVEGVRDRGIHVHQISCGRRRYLAEAREVGAFLRSTGASIVHSHLYHADIVCSWAARRCRLPKVSTVHGITRRGWKSDLYVWLDLRLLRGFDAIICVHDSLRQQLVESGCRPDRTHVIPNAFAPGCGLDRSEARAKLGLSDDRPVLGWIGRLSPEKGPDLFIDALAALEMPGVHAVLIGDGPERSSIAERVKRLDLDGRVRLAGTQADAASLLRAFDAVVLSSRAEASPMVLLEAMAAEVPLVAFAVGGVPEALDPSSAWLVAPGDTTALSRAITAALTRPQESRARAQASRQALEGRLHADRWVSSVDAVYDGVRSG